MLGRNHCLWEAVADVAQELQPLFFFLSWIGFLRPKTKKKNQYISHVPRIPLPRQTRARVLRSTTNRRSRAAHARAQTGSSLFCFLSTDEQELDGSGN